MSSQELCGHAAPARLHGVGVGGQLLVQLDHDALPGLIDLENAKYYPHMQKYSVSFLHGPVCVAVPQFDQLRIWLNLHISLVDVTAEHSNQVNLGSPQALTP